MLLVGDGTGGRLARLADQRLNVVQAVQGHLVFIDEQPFHLVAPCALGIGPGEQDGLVGTAGGLPGGLGDREVARIAGRIVCIVLGPGVEPYLQVDVGQRTRPPVWTILARLDGIVGG